VKANAGKLSCGHHGNGSSNQFACLTLAKMTGTPIADIPYRGAPQVNTDLIANRVQIYFGTLPTQVPLAKDGKVKIFGITAAGPRAHRARHPHAGRAGPHRPELHLLERAVRAGRHAASR
jgi:tripartite-type tricarboxylate transporter receptor subunit TctC